MLNRIGIPVSLSLLSLAACEPLTPEGNQARPALESGRTRASRPALTESALSSGCDPDAFACVGVDTLEYCAGSGYVDESCTSICRAAGFAASNGCGFDDYYGGDACFCDDVVSSPAPSCSPGWSCGGDALEYCDGYAIESWSCDSVCRDAGYDYALACDYDDYGEASCFCEYDYGGGTDYGGATGCAAGYEACGDGSCVPEAYICDGYLDCGDARDEAACATECIPGDVFCSGDFTIETCNDYGFWEPWDCDAVCQDAGYPYAESCSYDSFAGGDACFCGY